MQLKPKGKAEDACVKNSAAKKYFFPEVKLGEGCVFAKEACYGRCSEPQKTPQRAHKSLGKIAERRSQLDLLKRKTEFFQRVLRIPSSFKGGAP
jgi:hypothetical protein